MATTEAIEYPDGTVGWLLERLKGVDRDCYVVNVRGRRPLLAVEHHYYPGTASDSDTPAAGPDEGYVELEFG